MIGRLNHVAIAVPDVAVAAAGYRDRLGARISQAQDLPEHGVRVVFVNAVEASLAVGADFDLVARLFEASAVDVRHERVIFDEEDFFHKLGLDSVQPARAMGLWVSR